MQTTENGQLAERAQELYGTKLKAKLEPDNNGEHLAIEPDSGDHFLGRTMSEAYVKANAAHPNKKFYLVRVGFKAAVRFMSRTSL